MADDISNLRGTIEPNSSQLNADDLIGTTKVITVTAVKAGDADQPITINYDGDNGRPYKPCKSMRRVLINAWGDNGHEWVGQSMELYQDPAVKFGGVAVGGIRISRLTGITKTMNLSLTVTRAKRQPYKVEPLKVEQAKPKQDPAPMPDEVFSEKLPSVQQWIDSGKGDVERAIKQLESQGYTLSDEQKNQIQSEPVDTENV